MDPDRLTDWFFARRPIIAVGLALLTLASLYGLTRIGFDDNPRGIIRSDEADFALMEEVFRQFGSDENDCYLIVRSEDLFTAESVAALRRLVDEVRETDGVASTISLVDERLLVFDPLPRPVMPPSGSPPADFQRARREVEVHPLASDLLSDDGDYTLIRARLDGDELSVAEIQPAADALWDIVERWNRDSALQVWMTGIPPIRADAVNLVRSEAVRYTLWGAVAAVTMAVVLMRRVATVIVVCSASLGGAVWTLGGLGLVGERITVLTTVLPVLVMIVGFTDAVHLAVDIRHARAAGESPRQAARGALRHLTLACLLTSITTAVGFASLGVTRTEIVRRFGLASALGVVLMFVAVICLVPMLSSTWVGQGILPPLGARGRQLGAGVLGRLVDAVLRRRRAITAAGFALLVVLGAVASRLHPENEISENLPRDARAFVGLQLIDRHFGGMLPVYVCVDWPAEVSADSSELIRALERVHEICEQTPGVNHPVSFLNIASAVPGVGASRLPDEALRPVLAIEHRRALVTARSPEAGGKAMGALFVRLQDELDSLGSEFPGFEFRLTGSTVVATRNIGQMIVDLASSLALATVVIFGTISIAFRSLRLGLICIVPNALPLLITAAVIVAVDGSLRFSGVIVFSVCLGIAVDDTIHLVARFRRELAQCGDVELALRRAMIAVGSALITTTAVLLVGLCIPLTSEVPGNRMFAGLSCVAVSTALLADLILLPAMIACFVPNPARRDT